MANVLWIQQVVMSELDAGGPITTAAAVVTGLVLCVSLLMVFARLAGAADRH